MAFSASAWLFSSPTVPFGEKLSRSQAICWTVLAMIYRQSITCWHIPAIYLFLKTLTQVSYSEKEDWRRKEHTVFFLLDIFKMWPFVSWSGLFIYIGTSQKWLAMLNTEIWISGLCSIQIIWIKYITKMLEIDITSMLMHISVAKKRAVWLEDPTKSA